MSGSWKFCRIAGIPISVHWTFLVLVAWIALGSAMDDRNPAAVAARVGFILTVFGCIVLHELGHALMARRYGIRTADITLLPIGGVARLARMPDRPAQELAVALAGPAVTVAIVAALLLAGVRPWVWLQDGRLRLESGFFANLLTFNAFLALFNLLPAFPMDGGRVLRALLAMRTDYGRATRVAAWFGQAMAIGFAVLGLSVGNPMLVLIAVFVWLGAGAEASLVERRILLANVPVRDAMLADYLVVDADDSLGHAADLLLSGSQHDFPVIAGDKVVGFLTRDDLIAGLVHGGSEAKVADAFRPEVATVDVGSLLEPAAERLNQGDTPCLRVVQGAEDVGILTRDHLRDYLLVRAAGHNVAAMSAVQQRTRRPGVARSRELAS